VKQEIVEKPAAGAVQIAVEFRTRNETKLFQFKVAENMLFGTLRSKLQTALKVTDRYELRLVEAGSAQAVALETPLKNAPTFKARTVPALNLQCTLNPNSTQQPNQANQILTKARILHRNANECLEAAKDGVCPLKRARHNSVGNSAEPLEKRPKIKTLVHDTAELAKTFKNYAEMLTQMSEKLETSIENGRCDLETQKFILNTQDAGRYMAPMLQIMANISLPKTFSMFEEIDVSDEGLDRFRSRKRPVPGTAPVRVQPVVHIINRENHETGQISGQNCGFKKIL